MEKLRSIYIIGKALNKRVQFGIEHLHPGGVSTSVLKDKLDVSSMQTGFSDINLFDEVRPLDIPTE
jgi:hypothetical protein